MTWESLGLVKILTFFYLNIPKTRSVYVRWNIMQDWIKVFNFNYFLLLITNLLTFSELYYLEFCIELYSILFYSILFYSILFYSILNFPDLVVLSGSPHWLHHLQKMCVCVCVCVCGWVGFNLCIIKWEGFGWVKVLPLLNLYFFLVFQYKYLNILKTFSFNHTSKSFITGHFILSFILLFYFDFIICKKNIVYLFIYSWLKTQGATTVFLWAFLFLFYLIKLIKFKASYVTTTLNQHFNRLNIWTYLKQDQFTSDETLCEPELRFLIVSSSFNCKSINI